VLLCTSSLIAQQTYDIRFKLDNIDCEKNEVCYFVQIRSANENSWMLAGQNYRVFYDASRATYKVGSGISQLPPNDYAPFTLTTNVPGTDASAFNGLLPFDKTLGFLNYSIDLMDLASGGIALDASGEWINTTMLCFNVTDETINNANECINLIWARPGLTDAYATAFVEVSEWTGQNSTINAETDVYDDLDENDGDEACISALCGIGNPTEISDAACSDGVDNDNDGLVDCADPDCESTSPCINQEQQFFGIRMSLESLDCETNQACYSVELRSEGRNAFILGGQNYGLYYNSDIATFVQGVSIMEQDIFTPFTLIENSENVNSSNVGVLVFDSDLGFLNYSIDLSGFAASTFEVPTNTWVKTSTLCFNISADAIGDPSSCFKVTWGRQGLTDDYSSSFVEIDEYIDNTQSAPVTGMLYDDLNEEDGDASCFTQSCSTSENNAASCADGVDNDNDGLVDCADPTCEGLSVCSDPNIFVVGDFVFEDLNGNGIQESGENGINGIMISLYPDNNSDGEADDINSPLGVTVSASGPDGNGQYGFNVAAGKYLLIANDLADYTITSSNQGNDSTIDNDYNSNASTGTIEVEEGNTRNDIDLGLFRLGSLSGVAFNDANADGVQQNSEDGINNIIVNLYRDDNQDGVADDPNSPDATTSTASSNDIDGSYEFINLFPGSFVIEFKSGIGFTSTQADVGNNDNVDSDVNPSTGFTSTINLQSGQIIDNVYAGYVPGTAVGDLIWNDEDGDGIKDESESGVNGITVRLFNSNDDLVSNTVTATNPNTDEAGYYKFTDLDPGSYYIEVVLTAGFVSSEADVISDEENDSDLTNDNGPNTSSTFSLDQGEVICDLDAGIYQGGRVNGLVWQDDATGTMGVYEIDLDTPLEDILVKLLNSDNQVIAETQTNNAGEYSFNEIRVGSYAIMFVGPENFSFVNANVGNDDDIDSEVTNNTDGTTNLFSVGVGDVISAINAGLQFGTLPVDLISFTGYWNQKTDVNTLNWSTATEINNDLFEIERSFESTGGFKKVGEVEGNGTSSTIKDYSYTDTDISLSGTYYYKLKQKDFNGDFEYSEVIAVDVNRIGKAYVNILENPFSENLSIELFTEDHANAEFSLFDLNGRLIFNVFNNSNRLLKGKNRIAANTDNLQVGQYILMIKIAEERFVKKVIKL